MIYLDYSATTYTDKKVLKAFNNATQKYKGNPNSSHKLGLAAKQRINKSSENILKTLKIKDSSIIYTSGSTESNNLAIKGICKANKGKHIITTKMEHSSVIAPINRLCSSDYDVSFVNLTEDGLVDIEHLKSILTKDTVLVSIAGVESELGIKQNIKEISKVLEDFPNCYFHVDATQMIGKTKTDFNGVDLISFSAHKFFGIKGIGALIKKDKVKLMPILDGGASTTKLRSGTPALELIISLEKAISIAYEDFDKKLNYIRKLNKELKEFLLSFDDIKINNTKNSIDQIINFSMNDAKKMVELLNNNDIYLSTKSACSTQEALSKTIMAVYNDKKRANNSIRLSISYVTTKSEIKRFKKIFKECYEKIGEENENIKI